MVHRMLSASKTCQSFLIRLHWHPRAIALWRLSGWDVANIMAQYEETVGEVAGVFAPRLIPGLPAGQHAPTAEALDPVGLPKVVEPCLGQLPWANWCGGGPRRAKAPDACVLLTHVGRHGVGGLVHHLPGAEAELHGLGLLIVHGAVGQRGKAHVASAVHTVEELAGGRRLKVAVDGRVSAAPVLHGLLAAEAAHAVRLPREIEASAGQTLRRHPLSTGKVPEGVDAGTDGGPVHCFIGLQLTIISSHSSTDVKFLWKQKK